MNRRVLHIVPWLGLALLLLTAFGPVTNSIQKTWPGVSASPSTLDIQVSPTAAPSSVITFDAQRYDYTLYAVGVTGSSDYACCTYGAGSGGTPAATPKATASACAAGIYIAPSSYLIEDRTAANDLDCITVNGTMAFSVKSDK